MNFLYYFIRYTLVRNLNRLLKPKTLIVIAIICLIFFFGLKTESHASYYGNNTYSDPNNTAVIGYNSVVNDFLVALDNKKSNSLYSEIIEKLKDKSYGYYIYFDDSNGLSLINGYSYKQDTIHIVFYDLLFPDIDTSQYSNYMGINNIDIKYVTYKYRYTLTWNNLSKYDNDDQVYMPSCLYNYQPDLITSYLLNSSQEQTNDIVNAINEQTTAINQQTNTINAQTEYLQEQPQSQDFSSSDLPSDSGVTDITTDGINNIFALFYNAMTREPKTADIIEVSIPFTGKEFYIPYNYTNNFVPAAIKTIISMFWYYVFSVFIVRDIFKKIEKLKTGDIEHVETTNIKSDML